MQSTSWEMLGWRKHKLESRLLNRKPLYFHICFVQCVTNMYHVPSGKLWKRWEYQTTWPSSWETYMQVRKQHLELDMEQQTGSKYEKEYVKAVYCHPAYFTYMQNTSWETLGWRKHKLESRLLGEISITSNMQMIPPLWQIEELLKSLLMKVKEESEKLKTQHSKN